MFRFDPAKCLIDGIGKNRSLHEAIRGHDNAVLSGVIDGKRAIHGRMRVENGVHSSKASWNELPLFDLLPSRASSLLELLSSPATEQEKRYEIVFQDFHSMISSNDEERGSGFRV